MVSQSKEERIAAAKRSAAVIRQQNVGGTPANRSPSETARLPTVSDIVPLEDEGETPDFTSTPPRATPEEESLDDEPSQTPKAPRDGNIVPLLNLGGEEEPPAARRASLKAAKEEILIPEVEAYNLASASAPPSTATRVTKYKNLDEEFSLPSDLLKKDSNLIYPSSLAHLLKAATLIELFKLSQASFAAAFDLNEHTFKCHTKPNCTLAAGDMFAECINSGCAVFDSFIIFCLKSEGLKIDESKFLEDGSRVNKFPINKCGRAMAALGTVYISTGSLPPFEQWPAFTKTAFSIEERQMMAGFPLGSEPNHMLMIMGLAGTGASMARNSKIIAGHNWLMGVKPVELKKRIERITPDTEEKVQLLIRLQRIHWMATNRSFALHPFFLPLSITSNMTWNGGRNCSMAIHCLRFTREGLDADLNRYPPTLENAKLLFPATSERMIEKMRNCWNNQNERDYDNFMTFLDDDTEFSRILILESNRVLSMSPKGKIDLVMQNIVPKRCTEEAMQSELFPKDVVDKAAVTPRTRDNNPSKVIRIKVPDGMADIDQVKMMTSIMRSDMGTSVFGER